MSLRKKVTSCLDLFMIYVNLSVYRNKNTRSGKCAGKIYKHMDLLKPSIPTMLLALLQCPKTFS